MRDKGRVFSRNLPNHPSVTAALKLQGDGTKGRKCDVSAEHCEMGVEHSDPSSHCCSFSLHRLVLLQQYFCVVLARYTLLLSGKGIVKATNNHPSELDANT